MPRTVSTENKPAQKPTPTLPLPYLSGYDAECLAAAINQEIILKMSTTSSQLLHNQ
jgi:hypothetical protein